MGHEEKHSEKVGHEEKSLGSAAFLYLLTKLFLMSVFFFRINDEYECYLQKLSIAENVNTAISKKTELGFVRKDLT